MVFNLIPSRFKIGFLGMTACSLLYALRVNLNVAIVAMVVQSRTRFAENKHPDDWCSTDRTNTTHSDDDYDSTIKFDWNELIQGLVLSAYFYGFTVTQITGGLLTDRWGAKWVCGLGIGVPAFVNALSPLAAQEHYSWLIVIRIIIGAFHGLVHSSLFSMYAKWFPIQERTTAIAATQFGGNIGAVFMSPIAGYLAEIKLASGWPNIFYLSSLIHIIWLIPWWYCAHDTPAECNNIDPDEHLYILQNINTNITKRKASVPWKSILTSRAVYASILAKTSGTFGYYVLVTSVPSYLDAIFNLRITESSIYVALMYLAIGITLMIAGPLSNAVITRQSFTRTTVRKIFQSLALVGPAICLLIIPQIGCERIGVIVLIVCSMCLYGFITGGEYPIIPEYAPEFTGTVFGFANTLASSMGFLAPMIVGQILDYGSGDSWGSRYRWNLVFYTTAAFYLIGALFFYIFGSADRQSWAKITEPRASNIGPNCVTGGQSSNQNIEMSDFSLNNSYEKNINGRNNKEVQNRNKSNSSLASMISRKIGGKPKQQNTETPEWVRFKRNQFVF